MALRTLLAAMLAAATPAMARGTTPLTILVPDAAVAGAVRTTLGPRLPGLALRVGSAAPARRAPPPDVVLVPDTELRAACAAGRLRVLADDGGCGVPGPAERMTLGWDERRDAGGPPTWRDLWELARLPGKRGLPRQAAGTLEIALLADGVRPGDIYRTLGTPAGVERAFRKLDQLHPYVVWWTDGAEALRVLRSGAVLITVAPAAALAAGPHPGIGLQWADSLALPTAWAIPVAAPHVAAARQALALLREPAVASAIAIADAGAGAPPLEAEAGAGAGAGARQLVIDDAFWAAHPALADRFALWLAR